MAGFFIRVFGFIAARPLIAIDGARRGIRAIFKTPAILSRLLVGRALEIRTAARVDLTALFGSELRRHMIILSTSDHFALAAHSSEVRVACFDAALTGGRFRRRMAIVLTAFDGVCGTLQLSVFGKVTAPLWPTAACSVVGIGRVPVIYVPRNLIWRARPLKGVSALSLTAHLHARHLVHVARFSFVDPRIAGQFGKARPLATRFLFDTGTAAASTIDTSFISVLHDVCTR